MRKVILWSVFSALILTGQAPAPEGPLIRIADSALSSPPVFISYGDIRFTDPKNEVPTNPKVRRWLVEQIAREKPNALIISGDVPWHGEVTDDYAVFQTETAPWRAANIVVSTALGNHELNGTDKKQCLENWWTAFPKLRGHRWYSVQAGSQVMILNLDSNSSLLPGSEQQNWIIAQLAGLPKTVQWVFFNLHHPPVTDNEPILGADHNARPNEIALVTLLKSTPARKQVAFIAAGGHIHNYERFLQDGTVYLVSGGGGAAPVMTRRDPADLYKNPAEVNYHYVKFVLRGNQLEAQMIRVKDPGADSPQWEVRDSFTVPAP
jgi:hypothetical protein